MEDVFLGQMKGYILKEKQKKMNSVELMEFSMSESKLFAKGKSPQSKTDLWLMLTASTLLELIWYFGANTVIVQPLCLCVCHCKWPMLKNGNK